jgi:gluconolactonase
MKMFSIIAICLCVGPILAVSAPPDFLEGNHIVRLDPALDAIISTDAKVEKLPDSPGPGVREGPIWIRSGGYLLYSDMNAATINKWTPGSSEVSVFQKDTNVIGMAFDPQGRVVWGGWTDAGGEIVRLEKDGQRTVLYQGEELKAPNDLVFKSDGSLYFTDHGRHLHPQDPTPNNPNPTAYLLKDGKLTALFHSPMPNGIALSPDEKYLYINDSVKRVILRFKVRRDDTISHDGHLVIDQNSEGKPCPWRCAAGFPDGMKVDREGNIYSTGPGGIWIISPSGKHLGTILIPDHPSNFCFGDSDGKTIYVTARPGLYRVRSNIPGLHL